MKLAGSATLLQLLHPCTGVAAARWCSAQAPYCRGVAGLVTADTLQGQLAVRPRAVAVAAAAGGIAATAVGMCWQVVVGAAAGTG
jgi:hypothetical protein